MELKKNKKYELADKRPLFFGIGMVITMSFIVLAFEWKSPIDPLVTENPIEEEMWYVIEEPQITKQQVPQMPKPKIAKQVVSASMEIKVVEELVEAMTLDEPLVDVSEEITGTLDSDPDVVEIAEEPFIIVEEMPVFPGGESELFAFVTKNIRYPRSAARMGIEGRVYLSFVIDKDGSVTDVEVLKGIGAGCDEEAVRVLELLPNFLPGKQRGKPVKVRMQLPVNFTLQ